MVTSVTLLLRFDDVLASSPDGRCVSIADADAEAKSRSDAEWREIPFRGRTGRAEAPRPRDRPARPPTGGVDDRSVSRAKMPTGATRPDQRFALVRGRRKSARGGFGLLAQRFHPAPARRQAAPCRRSSSAAKPVRTAESRPSRKPSMRLPCCSAQSSRGGRARQPSRPPWPSRQTRHSQPQDPGQVAGDEGALRPVARRVRRDLLAGGRNRPTPRRANSQRGHRVAPLTPPVRRAAQFTTAEG